MMPLHSVLLKLEMQQKNALASADDNWVYIRD